MNKEVLNLSEKIADFLAELDPNPAIADPALLWTAAVSMTLHCKTQQHFDEMQKKALMVLAVMMDEAWKHRLQ